MTDGEALLRTILDDPSDDVLRLVYADWLDEAGQPDRAALIRVQIELRHIVSVDLTALEARLLGKVDDRVWQCRREWALPADVRTDWPTDVGGWEWHRGFPEVWHCPLALWEAHGSALASTAPVRRVVLTDREPQGSVSNPRKQERTWFRDDAYWVQRPDEGCLLPTHLFDFLEPDSFDVAMFDHAQTYPTRGDALVALSNACLARATASLLRIE